MTDSEPPGLSIREQQVFQLVREGRVDSEIAVRLGLGTGEVKQTVAVLVSKCGVPDRAGLVTWSPGARSSKRRRVFDGFADRMGPTAGGLALMAIVLGAAFFLFWRAWSGDDEPTDLSGLNTPIPPPSAVPSVVEQFKPLTYTEPQPFPARTTMWVARGCQLCAARGIPGDPFAIDRIEREAHTDPVRVTTTYQSPEPPQYVRSYIIRPDGSEIFVAVCAGGGCLTGRNDLISSTGIYRSGDGGDSFEPWIGYDLAVDVIGFAADRVILSLPRSQERSEPASVFVYSGQMVHFAIPAGVDLDSRPVGLEGNVYWRNETHTALVGPDGVVLAEVPTGLDAEIGSVVRRGDDIAVEFQNRRPGADEMVSYLSFINARSGQVSLYRGGAVILTLAGRYEAIHMATVQLPMAVEGTQGVRWVPASVSAISGRVSPIGDVFLEPPYRNNVSVRIIAMFFRSGTDD